MRQSLAVIWSTTMTDLRTAQVSSFPDDAAHMAPNASMHRQDWDRVTYDGLRRAIGGHTM
jgi:hypothetical protein